MTAMISIDLAQADTRARAGARHVYDAECALHAAQQTHVDSWIAAAADKLHEAIVEHLSALDALNEARGSFDGVLRPADS
jgi:hypothetical protein